jgi:hypothetical protein
MGAFTTREDITIKDEPGWENGEYITIKGVVGAGDMEAITTQKTALGADGKPESSSSISMVAALQRMIIDWMLKGDNNMPVPLYEGTGRNKRKRLEVIAELPPEYMGPVFVKISELMAGAQVEDVEGFLPGANELSKVS